MAYRENVDIAISSSNAFFPAAMWLRGFFHDAGKLVILTVGVTYLRWSKAQR
jgi:hypothetical protein